MKITDSSLCQRCLVTDFTEHFFFHCESVKSIWKVIENMIQSFTGRRIRLTLKDVMLGILEIPEVGKVDMLKINHMILIGEFVISRIKYGPKKYYLEVLEHELWIQKLLH